ncbi:MAG: aspartate-semialdehyde dehydrogenase [Alphaproteobacteria bacterium]|nr:aspartate-semialdehyde dehydrogenase [Alphaproteobacteria bacterium]
MNNKKIIIVGATGRVGNEMLSILDERNIPYKNIAIAASSKSEGKQINYMNHTLTVQNVCNVDFSKYDIALFSAGGEVSKQYAPIASDNGCIVIDNTSYFRMHNDIPLIVPEINISSLSRYNSKIISNPNCSTIQMVMPLKSLHDEFILEEVVVSTYQAVAGAGQKGIDELLEQTPKVLSNKDIEPNHFKKQIAFNVIPQIDTFSENGYTKEELKMMNETRKILELPDITISATCVRVPVLIGHACSVTATFRSDLNIKKAYEALSNFKGLKVIDDPDNYVFATPIDSAGKDAVLVSRLRIHPDKKNTISFWCVADNLRKGAALNAIQIAERL